MIKFEFGKKYIKLKNLKAGETFLFDGEPFIITNTDSDDNVRGIVNLLTGNLLIIEDNIEVNLKDFIIRKN